MLYNCMLYVVQYKDGTFRTRSHRRTSDLSKAYLFSQISHAKT